MFRFTETLDALRARGAASILGQSRIAHPGLAEELRRQLADADPARGGLIQEPVLEAAMPYVAADSTMDALAGDLLDPELIAALDGGAQPAGRSYRFLRGWRPHAHQLEAWRLLADAEKVQSVLVTSGTGSGKTECFLIPILNHLARKAAIEDLEGVEAVILYPLNALIESQRERLQEWTAPFKGRVRFGLYNGDLPDSVPWDQHRANPEMVVDRAALRARPPSVLVTNVTMLEYMLLRSADRPIREKSAGKLRYIVLDEAHSYVGAQAAEIALLLRRVCLAFGVAPSDVRFIATSATIGEGESTRDDLRRFLADVAGCSLDQVHVVYGRNRLPTLPAPGPARRFTEAELERMGGEDLYASLGAEPNVRGFLERLYAAPQPWPALAACAAKIGLSADALAAGFAQSRKGDDGLAPLRIHLFHRAMPGAWTCLNPECPGRGAADWPFGAVLSDHADACPHCNSQVLEIAACATCGDPFLAAAESADGLRLSPRPATGADDFAYDSDVSRNMDDNDDNEEEDQDEDEAAEDEPGPLRLIPWRTLPGATTLWTDGHGRLADGPREGFFAVAAFTADTHGVACPHCLASKKEGADTIRAIRYGAPLILGNATPILLADAAKTDHVTEAPPPFSGRQLLSFTDSRQGTARFSAKLQTASERNFTRSFLYHLVQNAGLTAEKADELDKVEQKIATFEPLAATNEEIARFLAGYREDRENILASAERGVTWAKAVEALSQRDEVRVWIKGVWAARDSLFEDPSRLADFLILRELDRRPKRAGSIETYGLACLRWDAIDSITEAPDAMLSLGGTAEDWRDFLQITATYFLRNNGAIDIEPETMHWVQHRRGLINYVLRPEDRGSNSRFWMRARPGRLSRPISMLARAFNLDIADRATRDTVNELADLAWTRLHKIMPTEGGLGRRLDLRAARIAPLKRAWWCPVTRRILDTTLRGVSPYADAPVGAPQEVVQALEMPVLPTPLFEATVSERQAAQVVLGAWLQGDPRVVTLKALGGWDNLTDRITLFSEYFRSAEHSAQQRNYLLRSYEKAFRAGAINVLNCSTTMEMGVDIGSVSHVMMTNVPPSIASYRQRIGRAGRRRQALAVGFTFCKDRPLDREAFREPLAFLRREVRSPKVALDSTTIVQRHVNALLFSAFNNEASADAMKLETGLFFGCPADPGEAEVTTAASAQFVDWARSATTESQYRDQVARLTRGSVLEADSTVFSRAAEVMQEVRRNFHVQWQALRGEHSVTVVTAVPEAQKQVEIQLRRHCGEFLLGYLGERGFLPSHGFPTGVVSFIHREPRRAAKSPQANNREEKLRRNAYPQRPLDVALREFAPGAEVVVDGLVHMSAGVTLNWKKPPDAEGAREIQSLRRRWTCPDCGEAGSTLTGEFGNTECPACLYQNAKISRYLEPAGFASDRLDEPHADTDFALQAGSTPPTVSAAGAPWTAMFDPQSGRRRTNREGVVFYCNPGPRGHGFDICLVCGRARASETGEDQPASVWEHKPLAGSRTEGGNCEGSNKPWAVRPQLSLGHEVTTDVFEFQPVGLTGRGIGLALGVALREGLARQLGIEADEMGVSVEQRKGPAGDKRLSIFLYDRASGGAGFSVAADDYLPEVIREAEHVLSCPLDCQGGCHACVLTADMDSRDAHRLDRHGALDLIRTLKADAAPDALDLAGIGAHLSADLIREIEVAVDAGGKVIVAVSGLSDIEEARDWRARPLARKLADRGVAVVLAATDGETRRLNGASILNLRDLLAEMGCELEEGPTVRFHNGARMVAEVVRRDGSGVVFASRDESTILPGPTWGRAGHAPIVRFKAADECWRGTRIDRAALREPAGAALVRIRSEFDAAIAFFGKRAAGKIRDICEEAQVWRGPLAAVTYEDRYLSSPLAVRLCLDTISGLAGVGAPRLRTRIVTRALRSNDGIPTQIGHDWRRKDDRDAVVAQYGQKKGLAVTLVATEPPHGRRLTLEFASGESAVVLLDQGFGAWAMTGRTPFDFRVSAATQVSVLERVSGMVVNREAGGTYFVVEPPAA